MKRIHFYILREATLPFIALLALGLALLLVNRLLKVLPWMFEFNVPFGELGLVLLWLLPSFMIYALPIAVWVGWMVAYGRLGADGELTALASLGWSPWKIMAPGLLTGILLTLMSLAVCEWGYAQGRIRFKTGFADLAAAAIGRSIQPGTVAQLDKGLWLAMPQAQGHNKPPLYIVREPDLVMLVQEAQALRGEPGFLLQNGIAYLRQATLPTFAAFETGTIVIDQLRGSEPHFNQREQTLSELWQVASHKKENQIELHQRLALSFAPLFAPLAALAAAPRRSRSARGWAVLAALLGLLAYYGLFTGGKQAVLNGWLPVTPGLWTANLFLALVTGGWLYRKTRYPGLP